MTVKAAARYRPWAAVAAGRRRSDGERLGPPVDLAAAVRRDRLDRTAGQRVIRGEQPAHRLDVGEPAIEQQGQRAMQSTDDLVAVEECGWHAKGAVRALCAQQPAVAEILLDPAYGQAKPFGNLG